MDKQVRINKDAIIKFEAMDKILDNLDGKVTEVRSSICEVFIMMKMLETRVGQLVRRPIGNEGRLPGQPQGPETAMTIQTHSREMEDHTKETTEITTEGPEFEMPSQYMKMPPCYFRAMLANMHEMTLCNLGASMVVMPRDVFEKLCLPELKPMDMCLVLGDNSIRYPVGIAEDAPVIKININGEGSAFNFQPRLEVCNTFIVKYVPPHRHFINEEPKKKEKSEKKKIKTKEVVASVKTKGQSQPVKTKKMTKPKNK
jgi:hypothetical protein